LFNKYKRIIEGDEDVGTFKVYKRRGAPGYFQYACEFLSNDKKTFYQILKEYLSIFSRHYKGLERIIYGWNRLKKKKQNRKFLGS
jgi:hypothetical protein